MEDEKEEVKGKQLEDMPLQRNNDQMLTKKILLTSGKGQEYHKNLVTKINEMKSFGTSEMQESRTYHGNKMFLESVSRKKSRK